MSTDTLPITLTGRTTVDRAGWSAMTLDEQAGAVSDAVADVDSWEWSEGDAEPRGTSGADTLSPATRTELERLLVEADAALFDAVQLGGDAHVERAGEAIDAARVVLADVPPVGEPRLDADTLAPATRADLERLLAESGDSGGLAGLEDAFALHDRVARLLADAAPAADWTAGTDAPLDTPLLVTIEDADGDRVVRSGRGQDSGRTPIAVDGGLAADERVVAWRRAPAPP